MDWLKLNNLHPTTRTLVLARSVRSLGQGVLVVDMTLYMHALGWSGLRIGMILTAAGLFGALMSLGVGIASDRLRRRPFLLVYEFIILACSLAALFTDQSIILSAAIVIAGFGRGANGAAGPFSPVEQAWLAEEVAPSRRGTVYSMNTAYGFFGMGMGALLAMFPEFLTHWLRSAPYASAVAPGAYRAVFIVVAAASLANLWLIFHAKENYYHRLRQRAVPVTEEDTRLRNEENKMLAGLVFLNSFNGLAVGFTGPLISYWFAIRFGVGPASIAPMMALTFFITGISSLLTGKLSQKTGIVKIVVRARLLGLILLILLPFIPFFWLASVVYLLRSALNRGSVGARQALTVGLVRDQRRGLATSLNALSMQLPQSFGPTFAGFLFSTGQLVVPFILGAACQGVYLLLYGNFFRKHNEPAGMEN